MLQDLSHTPSMQELTTLLRTNAQRLNQAFNLCVGMTPFEYHREVRMQTSKKLLTETLLSIQKISAQVGFSSPANFTAAFRKKYNTTPRNYRNANI